MEIEIKIKDIRQKMIDDFHEARFNSETEAVEFKESNKTQYNEELHNHVINHHLEYVLLYEKILTGGLVERNSEL